MKVFRGVYVRACVHACVSACVCVCVEGAWSACGVEGCGQHVLPRGVVSMWC